MNGIFRLSIAALLFATLPGSLAAKTFDNNQARQWEFELREFTCPIGGERFRQAVTHPHMALASFPDGSHMGDEWVDQQIPECPDNRLPILPDYAASEKGSGLLAYHEYTAEELAALPALLASAEWQALLGQTRTLRAYWLAKQIGRPAFDRFELLLHASWGAEDDAQRRTALEWQVADLPTLIDELGSDDERSAFARYHVVNALRELGRFEEALALLEAIESETPGVRMATDPDAMFASPAFAGPMRAVIAARDDDRYAIGLLNDDMASRICNTPMFARYRGANADRSCAAREAALAREQEERDAVYALLDDRPSLEARCDDTPAAARDETLAEACRRARHDREWAVGNAMADEQPVETAAQCEATQGEERETRLASACVSYEVYRDYALADQLDAEAAFFDTICDVRTQVGTGPFATACSEASRRRDNRQAIALWRDQSALRAICKDKQAQEDSYDGRHMACDALERGDRDPWWFESEPDESSDPHPLMTAAMPYARQMILAEVARRAAAE